MTKEEFIASAEKNGWKLDKWGALRHPYGTTTLRLKLLKKGVRLERWALKNWQRPGWGRYWKKIITYSTRSSCALHFTDQEKMTTPQRRGSI